jgi:hypothetical protein
VSADFLEINCTKKPGSSFGKTVVRLQRFIYCLAVFVVGNGIGFCASLEVDAAANQARFATQSAIAFYAAGALRSDETLWVDPDGNDSTGEIGRSDRPFASPEAASSRAPAGSTIVINPGSYSIYTSSVVVPPGGRIIGYGAVITNWLAPTFNPAFRVTDNSVIEGMHIVMGRTGSNVFQVAVGTGLAAVFSPTNFLIRRVTCFNGDTDVFYFSGTNTWGSIRDAHARSRWDTVAYNNIKDLKVFDSVFEAVGPNSKEGSEGLSHNVACSATVQGTRAEFHNCVFKAENTNSHNVYSVSAHGLGPFTNSFFFYNCTFTNNGLYSLGTNTDQNAYATTEITFLGCNVVLSNLDPRIRYTFLPRTNLVQNLTLTLTAYTEGETRANGNLSTTPVIRLKRSTKEIIQLLGDATTNRFSAAARLILETPLPGTSSRFVIRDGSHKVDVSAFFTYKQFIEGAKGSQMNTQSGAEQSKDYRILQFSLHDSGERQLNLRFNVTGFSTETSGNFIRLGTWTRTQRTVGNLSGTGSFRDDSGNYFLIVRGTLTVAGGELEVE